MQPYLNEIELHEHYYIQGPSGCQGEAMQLCAVVGNYYFNILTNLKWASFSSGYGHLTLNRASLWKVFAWHNGRRGI
jgi:hypothetical protein